MATLTKDGNNYIINRKTPWRPMGIVDLEDLGKVFNFAYDMIWGKGAHRDHRSGGTHRRKGGEIFINAFQGKLSEFAFYSVISQSGINIKEPDLSVWSLGRWDSFDILMENEKVNIKSTKFYGNLLLLETRDWNEKAEYLPNKNKEQNSDYDYFVLIRTKPDGERLLKDRRLLYSENIPEKNLKEIIFNNSWEYDIPGFITGNDFEVIIQAKQIVPKGALLNSSTEIDADNYYIQSGDMKPINELIELFAKKSKRFIHHFS